MEQQFCEGAQQDRQVDRETPSFSCLATEYPLDFGSVGRKLSYQLRLLAKLFEKGQMSSTGMASLSMGSLEFCRWSVWRSSGPSSGTYLA